MLASNAVDKLATAGRVDPASVTPLARSSVAIAVRKRSPLPLVDTEAGAHRQQAREMLAFMYSGAATDSKLGQGMEPALRNAFPCVATLPESQRV